MVKKIVVALTAFLLLIVLYFALLQSPIDAVYWSPPPIADALPIYDAGNHQLDQLSILNRDCHACEDVEIDSIWGLIGGDQAGNIIRIQNNKATKFANTGGRPLGLDIGDNHILYIADAIKGLLSLDLDGNLNVLSTSHNGRDFKFVDDVEFFDSILYFSDASSKYGLIDTKLDLFEHGGHGRLLSYNLRTGHTKMLMDSLQFANGVTVSADGSYVLINETGNYSVKKYWLKGNKSGTWEYFVENLSGFPDGISRGDGNIYWLTLIQPRVEELEKIMPWPWLRNQLLKLPASIVEPAPIYSGAVLAYDKNGQLIHNLQSDQPKFKQITSVEPYQDYIYLGSLEDNGIARIKINK